MAAAFAAIVWFILAVELTLAWNSVSNIYDLGSTGQLIPFIIGVMGLFRVMYLALPDQFEDVRDPKTLREFGCVAGICADSIEEESKDTSEGTSTLRIICRLAIPSAQRQDRKVQRYEQPSAAMEL